MTAILKRYRVFLLFSCVGVALLFIAPDTGWRAVDLTWNNVLEMLSFLPPIFVLLGLLDVWIDRETMMKYMGDNSGLRGNLLAFILGSAAAGPLYAAFPMAGVMLKKSASMMNVFIFIGAWSTTKVRRIQLASATPSKLNEKARWYSPLASPSNQRLRGVWAMHTLPGKNGTTSARQ